MRWRREAKDRHIRVQFMSEINNEDGWVWRMVNGVFETRTLTSYTLKIYTVTKVHMRTSALSREIRSSAKELTGSFTESEVVHDFVSIVRGCRSQRIKRRGKLSSPIEEKQPRV